MACANATRKEQIAALLYKERATFYRAATPDGGDFGQASSDPDVVVLANEPCRIASSQRDAAESATTGQVQSSVPVDLFMSPDTDRPDAAEYAIITTQDNRRLEVAGSNPTTDMLELRVDCFEKR